MAAKTTLTTKTRKKLAHAKAKAAGRGVKKTHPATPTKAKKKGAPKRAAQPRAAKAAAKKKVTVKRGKPAKAPKRSPVKKAAAKRAAATSKKKVAKKKVAPKARKVAPKARRVAPKARKVARAVAPKRAPKKAEKRAPTKKPRAAAPRRAAAPPPAKARKVEAPARKVEAPVRKAAAPPPAKVRKAEPEARKKVLAVAKEAPKEVAGPGKPVVREALPAKIVGKGRAAEPKHLAGEPVPPRMTGKQAASVPQDRRSGTTSKREKAPRSERTRSQPPPRVRSSSPPSSRHIPSLVSLPIPLLPSVRRPSIEERSASIDVRLAAQTEDFRKRYIESFDMSWIYHDSALEGVVYTFEELRAGLSGQVLPVTDSTIQPVCEDIRRHKEAIDFVRDFATKKRLPVTLDVLKKIYLILRPEEGDVKTVKYRKDVPQHRLYFHEYTAPDKIAYKMRQIVDWLNDPETRKTRNGIRIAARAHYDILRVFPFATESGKVARLFMNLLLLRSGLPPSIIHSTERQRYYEALKGSATTVLQMVQESVENALSSVEKLLDEHDSRMRAVVS